MPIRDSHIPDSYSEKINLRVGLSYHFKLTFDSEQLCETFQSDLRLLPRQAYRELHARRTVPFPVMAFHASFVSPIKVNGLQSSAEINSTQLLSKCAIRRQYTPSCCAQSRRPNTDPLLEMRNINYEVPGNQDVKLFQNMNFSVYPGEFIVVIGQNGAGKTTALNLMIGLAQVRKGDGDIYWMGEKMKPSNLMANIGVVMQNPADYFFTPTVLDELVLGREKNPDDVRRVLSAVGLTNVSLLANPASLSGGQVRRLAIASQLMRDPLPTLFVMDEPLAAVDWTARRDIVELLGSLKSQFSIVVVSHEPDDLLDFADRVVEVGRGDMHEIDAKIVKKAQEVRRRRRAETRERAIKEALIYKEQMAAKAKATN